MCCGASTNHGPERGVRGGGDDFDVLSVIRPPPPCPGGGGVRVSTCWPCG